MLPYIECQCSCKHYQSNDYFDCIGSIALIFFCLLGLHVGSHHYQQPQAPCHACRYYLNFNDQTAYYTTKCMRSSKFYIYFCEVDLLCRFRRSYLEAENILFVFGKRYVKYIIMPLEDFEIKEALGKGSFGSVCKCVRRSDGEVYAMKQIKLQKLKEKDKKNALNEIRFLASIECPFVVEYKQAFYDEKSETLCIVMEYANQGDLQYRVKKALLNKTRIPEEQIWKVAYECLEGLNKLHESNIIHRDIKPANIFFRKGIAKIGDLNVAKHLVDVFTHTQTGTPYYASPEVWNQQPYNYKTDTWSLGCVLYEMAMLKPPFRADTPRMLLKKIMQGEYEKIGAPYSKELSSFIARLMTHNQKKRPEIKEILCYPKMMDMKSNFEGQEKIDEKLLNTIKFPNNLRLLNENLPRPKYESRCKTSKLLPDPVDEAKGTKSTVKLPLPSLKLITSQKNLLLPPSQKAMHEHREGGQMARRPKILNKNGSQKLIF